MLVLSYNNISTNSFITEYCNAENKLYILSHLFNLELASLCALRNVLNSYPNVISVDSIARKITVKAISTFNIRKIADMSLYLKKYEKEYVYLWNVDYDKLSHNFSFALVKEHDLKLVGDGLVTMRKIKLDDILSTI